MGIEEIWDIDLVVEHLEAAFEQKKFIFWGRSMGAVAGLLYLYRNVEKQNKFLAGVFDSPFHSL